MSERVEKIMKNYSQMVMERNCLKNQIKNFIGVSETEMINSMSFDRPEGERIKTSNISDKTANIAITYKNKMNRINQEWLDHLEKKYAIISEEIIFFESAITSLSGNLSEIMMDMIVGGLTWDDLSYKHHISRTMVAKYRKKAIRELEILYCIHENEIAEYMLS